MSQTELFSLFALLCPGTFVIVALCSFYQPGQRPSMVKTGSIIAAWLNIIVAIVACMLVGRYGLLQSPLAGFQQFGFSLRLDALSVTMLTMIALLSFIIVKFSLNYLDGDERQGAFLGRLCATIAAVQLLVVAGNLGLLIAAWAVTSLQLHRLLVFYRNRPGAIIAARKKFIVARLAEVCLVLAAILLFRQFDTGNLELIFTGLKNLPEGHWNITVEVAAGLVALAAILKSAQFPAYGWLIEVMETPTPVSALLHAGVLNAGPFLIIRMAFLMEQATIAPVLLLVAGSFTALFASVAYTTQPSVKVALGYSSAAHMGFSLMVCGMGSYGAAMLHIMAHSFYKAHAFLSSGSVVEVARAGKITIQERLGNPWRILAAFLIAAAIFSGLAFAWGISPSTDFSLLAIGAIVVLGVTQLIATALDSAKPWYATLRAGAMALGVITAFFTLEAMIRITLQSQITMLAAPQAHIMWLVAGIVLIYALVILLQIVSPFLAKNKWTYALWVHFRHGLYANAWFDKLTGALRQRATILNN